MRITTLTLLSVLTLATAVIITGCADEPAGTENSPPAATDPHAEHAHPSEGPHGGSLIELGQEQYHAELIHDEASGSVTIYLLDGMAKTAAPIEATEITINATHDGNAEQFKLAARPAAEDPPGKSSKFVSTDKHLSDHLHDGHAQARLVVKIEGKSFNGEIAHDHDHAH